MDVTERERRQRIMARIIIANAAGHTEHAYDVADTTEAGQAAVVEAQRLISDARAAGCLVARQDTTGADGGHVIDRLPFDPTVEEYQIVAPLVGG